MSNIKNTQFIIPTKEALAEEFSLSDSLPFMDQAQYNRGKLYLDQKMEDARSQINFYYEDMQKVLARKSKPQFGTDDYENNAGKEMIQKREIFNNQLKDL